MELSREDLHFVVSRLPKDIKALMKDRGVILGGGFIRATIAGEKPSDIDLFGKSKDQLEAAARALKDSRHGCRFHESKNAYTVLSSSRMPVQFIHRWVFERPRDCMDSFDFTVAQAVIWHDGVIWLSACHEAFYRDLAARRLTYCAPIRNEDAGGSLLRVRKFLKRGYNIQSPSLAAVLARLCAAVEWGKIENEKDSARVLCDLLREVDPLVAIDGLALVDEHEVVEGAV